MGGHFGLASGVEAGDPGVGQTRFRAARLRLIAGIDTRVDEDPNQGMGFLVFSEVSPHQSLGGELRYLRWFNPHLIGFVGATGVLAPKTLLGGDFGLQFHMPFDSAGTTLFVEPSFSAIALGTDLPGDKMLIWGLVSFGIHSNL
jgi:hypothetical protein